MKQTQIQILQESGIALLAKASRCEKTSDVQTFTDLGLKCLKEAREILDTLRSNSVFVFIQCCWHMHRDSRNFGVYLEFCARNKLEVVSEVDFDSISADLYLKISEMSETKLLGS